MTAGRRGVDLKVKVVHIQGRPAPAYVAVARAVIEEEPRHVGTVLSEAGLHVDRRVRAVVPQLHVQLDRLARISHTVAVAHALADIVVVDDLIVVRYWPHRLRIHQDIVDVPTAIVVGNTVDGIEMEAQPHRATGIGGQIHRCLVPGPHRPARDLDLVCEGPAIHRDLDPFLVPGGRVHLIGKETIGQRSRIVLVERDDTIRIRVIAGPQTAVANDHQLPAPHRCAGHHHRRTGDDL